MNRFLPTFAAPLLAAFLAVDGGAGYKGGVRTLPTYSSNPYTGKQTVSGGYHNEYTGGGYSYEKSTNSMTGRTTASAEGFNPYTGTHAAGAVSTGPGGGVTRAGAAYNPYTGGEAHAASY